MALLSSANIYAQSAQQLAEVWDKQHISRIFPSDVRHADLKKYIEELRRIGLKTEQVGVSNAGREIFQIEWGRGPLKVFMWSQMHGDEPTATSALVDMFAVLERERGADWVKRIAETITIRAVPMLNPDGAELYQRRNLQGIDINRDAQNLATPEARLLKRLRDDWSPAIGFNLHNQGALTTVGSTTRQAAISLLVVFGDAAKTRTPTIERSERVAAAIVNALERFIPGHIARYSDEWTPSAFGDNFSKWGTPAILIETGALNGRDEMFLVRMNFVAFMTALSSLATGSEAREDAGKYRLLPNNTSGGLVDMIFRNATFAPRHAAANGRSGALALVYERRRASLPPSVVVRAVGDVGQRRALVEYDAAGFVIAQRYGRIAAGEHAELLFYKADRAIDWTAADLERRFPPDAIFSLGKWTKGEGLVRRR